MGLSEAAGAGAVYVHTHNTLAADILEDSYAHRHTHTSHTSHTSMYLYARTHAYMYIYMYACMHACMHACRYACVCGRQRAFCSTWPRHAHGTSARSKDLHSLHLALIYTVVHTGPTYSLRLYSFIHMAGFTSLPPDLCACLARALRVPCSHCAPLSATQ